MIKFLTRLFPRRVETKTSEAQFLKHQRPPQRLPASPPLAGLHNIPRARELTVEEAAQALAKADLDHREALLRRAYGYENW